MYVPLRIRSNYSLLAGGSFVDTLVAKAARLGLPALALTDENNLYGIRVFARKARESGIKPVFGAIVDGPEGGAVLLIRNRTGYENLCEILSRRHLEEDFRLVPAIAESQDGLVVLTPCLSLAESLAGKLDRGRLWLELLRPGGPGAEKEIPGAARRLGIRVAASCDVYFADSWDIVVHEVLQSIRTHRRLATVESPVRRQGGYLRSPKEFDRLFADVPELVNATREIAESCAFDFRDFPPVFPRVGDDSADRLREKARRGALARYGQIPAEVWYRLNRECEFIIRKGFADYFLVVEDIARHARAMGSPVAGRGSGASSVAAYCMGITNVDPIRYHLPFERFLNEKREDFPDLDLDFCWRARDEIIDYVYRKYGEDHVAMVATYVTMQPRLAFREVAKIVGIPNPAITRLADRIEAGGNMENAGPSSVDPRRVKQALFYAGKCNGFPHHVSVHCGGLVITPDRMARHAPLQRAAKGVVITQYDKDSVEEAGLVKLDLLGNRALSAVAESAGHVSGAYGVAIDPETLADRDEPTARLLASGETIGVNQLESPAMRRLLRQLRPACMKDLMKTLALIRPGAASLGMKEAFIRRSRAEEAVPPIDRRVDGILRETHGIMLYEDDALLVAVALANLPPGEADRFRRAVTKCRSDRERADLSRAFLGHCRRNGVDPRISADLWSQMAKFNSYSFCRAHAASYARIAWANAYVKSHYPLEFWVGVLNNNQGLYDKWVYVEAAKREGVRILPPCVNRSGEEFTLDGGAIRVGLGRIRELTAAGKESIRRNRPFRHLTDMVLRTCLRRGDIANLIRTGALDFMGKPRARLLRELDLLFGAASRLRGHPLLFEIPEPFVNDNNFPADSEIQRWQDEWAVMGLSSGKHPVAYMRPGLKEKGIVSSRWIGERIGREIRLCGMPATARTTTAGKGEKMCFITLCDEDGMFEVTLFPDVFSRYRQTLVENQSGLFWVAGKAESQCDAISVTAEEIGRVG